MAKTSYPRRDDKTDSLNRQWFGATIWGFLTRRKGGTRWTSADVLTYAFLILGTLLMFFPVIWLTLSSFKPSAYLGELPPTFFPYWDVTITLPGYDKPLTMVEVRGDDGSIRKLAKLPIPPGRNTQVIDPDNLTAGAFEVPTSSVKSMRTIRFALDNFQEGINSFPFFTYLRNSIVVTLAATAVTLVINSMAAFALSKYRFRGRTAFFILIISTLMVPISVILVPVFLVVSTVGWMGNLLGVIIPPAATPTGVFLLRQYMLTIPDELLEAARIDGASEWRIYWRIMLPLTAPALAVLAVFSIMWRWNDFLWPLIVLGGREEVSTLQLGLRSLSSDLTSRTHLILSMTVLTVIPITIVFAFLQKYIASGIASTGVKG